MRNRKLYESVERLVKQRKNESKEKRNFVENFCHQQLFRRKLIPKDNSTKINDIMHNFKSIHTYINVDHLIDCINQLHSEEVKKTNRAEASQFLNRFSKLDKHKRYMSESDELGKKVLWRAQSALKDHYQTFFPGQDSHVKDVIKILEDESTVFGDSLKNNEANPVMSFCQKRNMFESTNGKEDEEKQSWNYYENTSEHWDYLRRISEEGQNSKGWIRSSDSVDLCKKRKKMFQLARIYLHMILEDEHKKKWSEKDKQNKARLGHKNLNARPSNFAKGRTLHKKKTSLFLLNKQIIENDQVLTDIPEQRAIKPIQSPIRRSSKRQRSLFKQSQSRQIAIQKMNSFLQDLEEDENILRKQKNIDLIALNKFAEKINEDIHLSTRRVLWDDNERMKQISAALSRQDIKSNKDKKNNKSRDK